MEKMGKMLLAALASTVMWLPAYALADHHDGCDHGNSNKECREDPQPDRGKDCEEHGKPGVGGGENEDHCAESTPSPEPSVEPSPTDPPVGPTVEPSPSTAPPKKEVPPTTVLPRLDPPSDGLAPTGVSVGAGVAGIVMMAGGWLMRRRR